MTSTNMVNHWLNSLSNEHITNKEQVNELFDELNNYSIINQTYESFFDEYSVTSKPLFNKDMLNDFILFCYKNRK